MRKNLIIALSIILTSCSAKMLMPSDADAKRGSAKFPGLTTAELVEGRQLYEAKCTTCHGAKKASSHNEDQWRKIVPDMAARSKKNGVGDISAAEQDKILKYLITMGSR